MKMVGKTESFFKFFKACKELQSIVKKETTNKFKDYKYMSLPDFLKDSYEVMENHGFMFFFFSEEYKETDRTRLIVTVLNKEDSTFNLESSITMHATKDEPPEISSKGKDITNFNQRVGSSITYYRRYLLSIALGIMPDDDLDGETSKPKEESKQASSNYSSYQPKKPSGTSSSGVPF